MPESNLFFFDVESIGLYGEGFAVGGVLTDSDGKLIEELQYSMHPSFAAGSPEGRAWVEKNIPKILPYTHDTGQELRKAFWEKLQYYLEKDAKVITDCGYPVETNFLATCVTEQFKPGPMLVPYPLLDLATLLESKGIDPKRIFERRPEELPVHNPLADARQTSRLWFQHI